MSEPEATAYDVLPYQSGARLSSYVDRIAVIGRLLGLESAHSNDARVLELGCGDGGNLIPMAVSLPGSEFVGIDLAPTAIERGANAIRQLGLANISLARGDIAEVGAELGTFDYVIAHGVYSWVPEEVRVALLRLIKKVMRPHGLAFVSYNTEPGDHVRGILRGMMRMHTRAISDPPKKIEQARALLGMLSLAPGQAGDAYRLLLQSEVGRALRQSDFLLYHDDLADISQPFFFAEFMDAAHASDLEFASEATFHAMSLASLPETLAGPLAELGQKDIIAKEQYLDFLTCRGFRQTLLCHAEARLDRNVTAKRIARFRFFSAASRANDDEAGPDLVQFRNANASTLATDSALAIAALDLLAARFPRSVTFDEIVSHTGAETAADVETIAEMLFRAYSGGVIGLRIFEPAIACGVSDRPVASPWVRLRASTRSVVNLNHETTILDRSDPDLIALLDGTRDLTGLAASLGRGVGDLRAKLTDFAARGLLVG